MSVERNNDDLGSNDEAWIYEQYKKITENDENSATTKLKALEAMREMLTKRRTRELEELMNAGVGRYQPREEVKDDTDV